MNSPRISIPRQTGPAPSPSNQYFLKPKAFDCCSAGFTVIEILMVITILSFLIGIAAYISGDFFRSSSFGSDVNAFGISLQRARSRAINNINESPHGVKVVNGDYIIFQGVSYPGVNQEIIKGNSNYTFNPANPEIVFSQLTGDSTYNGDIVISDGFKTATVTLNPQGRIDF